MDPEPELLDDDPVRLPPDWDLDAEPMSRTVQHLPRWAWLAALVLVLGVAVTVVDGASRAQESTRVAACQEQLRQATGYVERRLGLVDNYLQPTLATDGRVQQLHLADLMSARAHRVLARVRQADSYCRQVTVRPWHWGLAERQSASTAYSAALVTFVQLVAAQGRLPFEADQTMQRLREAVGINGG